MVEKKQSVQQIGTYRSNRLWYGSIDRARKMKSFFFLYTFLPLFASAFHIKSLTEETKRCSSISDLLTDFCNHHNSEVNYIGNIGNIGFKKTIVMKLASAVRHGRQLAKPLRSIPCSYSPNRVLSTKTDSFLSGSSSVYIEQMYDSWRKEPAR